jgi:hypothetical protein
MTNRELLIVGVAAIALIVAFITGDVVGRRDANSRCATQARHTLAVSKSGHSDDITPRFVQLTLVSCG